MFKFRTDRSIMIFFILVVLISITACSNKSSSISIGSRLIEAERNQNENPNQLHSTQFMQEQERDDEGFIEGQCMHQGSTISVDEANAIEKTLDEDVDSTSLVGTYPIVDTGLTTFYSNTKEITRPNVGEAYYGQDATYENNVMSYTDNGDGTITDNVTGLMWQKDPGEKMTWEEAAAMVKDFELAGYKDWRLPTIKELYSVKSTYIINRLPKVRAKI